MQYADILSYSYLTEWICLVTRHSIRFVHKRRYTKRTQHEPKHWLQIRCTQTLCTQVTLTRHFIRFGHKRHCTKRTDFRYATPNALTLEYIRFIHCRRYAEHACSRCTTPNTLTLSYIRYLHYRRYLRNGRYNSETYAMDATPSTRALGKLHHYEFYSLFSP